MLYAQLCSSPRAANKCWNLEQYFQETLLFHNFCGQLSELVEPSPVLNLLFRYSSLPSFLEKSFAQGSGAEMLCGSSQHCQLSYTFLWNRNAFSLPFPFFFTTIVFLLFGGSDSSLLSPLGSSLHSAGLCFLHGEGFLLNPSPSLGIMDHLPYRAEIHTHPFSKEALRMFKMWKQFRERNGGV